MSHHRPRTVVITGASSGIGRATALGFARPGQALVLTARRREALEELATECRGLGAEVRVAPAEITDPDTVASIARDTVEEFGWLDVWVNNAAVMSYGRIEEMPVAWWRRTIEVNLLGTYHGIRAALPWMREQGSGVLINVSSVLGKTPSPHQSAYVASKYAIRALSGAVRQEVRDAGGISVCTVLPGAVDTPLFRSGANVTGHQVEPPGPPIDARRVAEAIVRCADRPRREVIVGASTRTGLVANRAAPALTERLFGHVVDRVNFTSEPAARTDGNLFQPATTGARIDDGWRAEDGWTPVDGRRAEDGGRRRGVRAVAVGAGAAAAAVVAARALRNRSW
jgi:short-subunit dehydrogenase